MKRKLLTIIAVLLVVIMAGCAAIAQEGNKVEKDPKSANAGAQTKPAETKPATTTTTTKSKKTVAQVKKIALEHAGVKESAARDLEVELDKEGTKVYYEVTFESGGYDYEYDIDAYTGKILHREKERDD